MIDGFYLSNGLHKNEPDGQDAVRLILAAAAPKLEASS